MKKPRTRPPAVPKHLRHLPSWSMSRIDALLAHLLHGRPQNRVSELDRLLNEHRVRLLLQHDVGFSIVCAGGDCACAASGDVLMKQLADGDYEGEQAYEQAMKLGWTEIEPAPSDVQIAHFYGLCPECKAAIDAEEAELK